MSITNEELPAGKEQPSNGKPVKQYGRSVLLTAGARFWRATLVFLAVMVVNAIVQPLLALPGIIPSLGSISFWLLSLASYAVMVLSLGVICSAALGVANGKVSIRAALAGLRPNFWNFVLWTVVWTIAVVIGLSLWTIPGYLVMILTPFVVLAAADGKRNALAANFSAIKGRLGRYVVTVLFSLIVFLFMYVVVGLTSWITTGAPAAVLCWIFLGIVGSWLLTAWALLYRSTPVGAAQQNND